MDKCYALKGSEKATKTDESKSEHGTLTVLEAVATIQLVCQSLAKTFV